MPDPSLTPDIHFPKGGVHRSLAFGRQPVRQDRNGVYVRTAVYAANVRAYERATGRDRGGSRVGLTRAVADPVTPEEVWLVQHLDTITTVNPMASQNLSGRVVFLVAVALGQIKTWVSGDATWAVPTNNTGETPPVNISGTMQSAANNQRLYFVDGVNMIFYYPANNSLEKWVATAGQLPADSAGNRPRLICTYRGRTVLSGLPLDSQNWFMSAVGDPGNFDYLPANPSATQAVAGNNSPYGLIGDTITGLCPVRDDVLIFFGDHTIYAMRGDPADNGSIDLISDVIGAAYGEAFCKDPSGRIYFFGSKPGVWMMPPGGGAPQLISEPIEPLLRDIDTGNSVIRLVWDEDGKGVMVFVTAAAQPGATRHYFWDTRMQAWFPDVYANNDHNPLAVVAYDGNLPADRAVMIGGWDGYVRRLDAGAATDDGTAIASEVWLGPILTQSTDEMLLYEVQGVLGEASGDVNWDVYAGETAEAAVADAPYASGTFGASRTYTQPVRVAGHAIYIKLSSVSRWAMETVRCRFDARGRTRQRRG